jgi:hypothetical protein
VTIDIPPGPACDGCGEEGAIMSLLNYADYSQIKVGLNCAPDFLRSIADGMDGKSTAEPATEPEPEPEPESKMTPEEWSAVVATLPDVEDEPGSARDHWASTTNVRRSTHGHRTPKGATGTPRKDDPQ